MKYPILYKSNEADFFAMGLGPIQMLKATVTQERNGIFIFEGEILTDNPLFPLALENYIIKAGADHLLKDQRFRIKRIVPNHNGKAEIYAEHVSYLSRELTIKPEVNITGSAQVALNQWKASIVESNPFVVSSDIATSASTKWRIDKVSNPMMALGGVEGSILDRWGGEYLFDNYHIRLLKKRGTTAQTVLAYGRNITDFEQERNILNTYTSVAPYAIYTDDNEKEIIVTIDGYVVDSEHVDKYPNRVTMPIDFSSEFGHDEIPTKARLTTLAQQYIKDNEIGVPTTSIKISFLDLSQTADYVDYAFLEQVNLCDDVRVHYPKLGVNTIAKVVRVVWNCLTESYDEIEIGQKRMSLASQIQEQNKVIQEINTQVNQSQVSADGKNMIFYGLYGENGLGEPNATKIGDSWFKPNGLETELYVWTGIEWKLIMSTSLFNEINETIKDLDDELELTTTTANDAVNKAQQAIRDIGFANSAIEAADGKISSLEQNLDGFQQVVQNTYADKTTVTALATQWTQTTELANGHTSAINSLGDNLNLRVTTDEFKKSMGLKNLIVNSGNLQNTLGWSGEIVLAKHVFYKNNTANLFCIRNATTGEKTASGSYFNILPSTEYTLKFTGFAGTNVKHMDVWLLSRKKGSSASYDNSKLIITTKLSPSGLDTRTLTFTTNSTDDQAYIRFDNNGSTDGTDSLLFFVDISLVKGSVAPNDWFSAESDDIITQINLSPESLLIASKRIYIDGETYITNGAIKNAHIADLAVDGAKIANASIASAKIINLDASKITVGTLTGHTINGAYINGGKINGTSFFNSGADGDMSIANGRIRAKDFFVEAEGSLTSLASYVVVRSNQSHVFLQPANGYEVAVTSIRTAGGVGNYRPIRASHFRGGNTNATFEAMDGYSVLRSSGDSQPVYLQGNEIRATSVSSAGNYVAVRASAFPTGSLETLKTDIKKYTDSALQIIRDATIYDYKLKEDLKRGRVKTRIGLVIGQGYNTPSEIIDGDGVEQYAMNSLGWKAIQELDTAQITMNFDIWQLKNEIKELKNEINNLRQVVV